MYPRKIIELGGRTWWWETNMYTLVHWCDDMFLFLPSITGHSKSALRMCVEQRSSWLTLNISSCTFGNVTELLNMADLLLIYLLKMVIFHGYVNLCRRVMMSPKQSSKLQSVATGKCPPVRSWFMIPTIFISHINPTVAGVHCTNLGGGGFM